MGFGVSHKRRLLVVLGCIVAFFVILAGRLFYLMVIRGPELEEMALSQWTRDTTIAAQRGEIRDNNGVVLAQSGTAYKVLLRPKLIETDEKRKQVTNKLVEILGMDQAYVMSRVSNTKKEQIELKRGIDRATKERIDNEITYAGLTEEDKATRSTTPGVVTAVDTRRFYPNGTLFSQLLGFTTVDGTGQAGLEQKYDSYLRGETGRTIMETDNKGNALAYGAEEVIAPTDGYDIVLAADSVVQSFLEKALKEAVEVNQAENAQGILFNCKTGAIMALASEPDFDPNDPPRSDMALLNSLMRERVVTDAYEPGSTFKIVTLAAALDSGAVTTEDTFNCPGYYYVNGERIRCWRSAGHGQQTLTEAVGNSCNVAFMQMTQRMGADVFYDYLYAFGFGSATGSGIAGEAAGIVTNQKYMTENTLMRMGFGQSIAVTPLQLATAAAAAVNGGNLLQPYILDRIVTNDGSVLRESKTVTQRRAIKSETSAKVRAILENVVSNGSGKNAQIPGYRVGGKTGTAQKYEDGKIADGKLIASFLGFTPADDPEYLALILVDEPKVGTIFGSTVAAPFVADVLEETLRYYGHMPETGASFIEVPDVVGREMDGARSELSAAGLTGIYQGTGEVIAQIPKAGERVAEGSGVLLYTLDTDVEYTQDAVPEGETPEDAAALLVPDLTGMTRLAAARTLRDAGLMMTVPGGQKGKVIRQVPSAGVSVEKGATVLVEFSEAELGTTEE